MIRPRNLLAVVIAAAIATLIVWFLRRTLRDEPEVGAGSATPVSTATAGSSGVDVPGGAGTGAEADEPEEKRYRVIDADARMALATRIAAARAAREAREAGKPAPAVPGPAPGDPPPLPGTLSVDEILAGVMPLLPLFKECYQAGLDRRTIKAGTVTFTMKLAGEPEVGTLVDSAELGGDPAFLADADLAQCLQETMMSAELPPMADGSVVESSVTMQFAEHEPAGE